MLPFLTESFANPTGAHRAARSARRAIDDARDEIAAVTGFPPGGVVFTSGGTESDALAVLGGCAPGRRVVCSAVEHPAVLENVDSVGGTVVGVDDRGRIDLEALAATLDDPDLPTVGVVSVMAVNNEVGTIEPIAEVVEVVRRHRPDCRVHVDAVQALCWIDLRTALAGVDMVSLSAHKFGGPKGVGALVLGGGVTVVPRQRGGGQERDRRSGTNNVAGIVGMGAAATSADADRCVQVIRVGGLRDRLVGEVRSRFTQVREVGGDDDRSWKVAGNAHLLVDGVDSEVLLYLLDDRGVAASAASSCASGAQHSSGVLAAMGVDANLARGALRLTLGHDTTEDEVERVVEIMDDVLAKVLVS